MARRIFSFVVTNCLAGNTDDSFERLDFATGERVEPGDALDFLAKEFHAQAVFASGGPDFDGIAAHAEMAALEGDIVAVVLEADEAGEELFARNAAAHAHGNNHFLVIFLAADAVNAGHAGDDHDVAPRK